MSAATGKFFDRVKDTASAVSGSTVTLNNSAPTGFQTFGTPYANTDVVPAYLITDGTNWEVSYGAYTSSGTTLARASVPIASSNAGAQVASFTGTITVAVVDPAVFTNSDLQGIPSGWVYSNWNPGTAQGTAATVLATVYYIPIFIRQWFSAVTIHFNISSLATGTGTSAVGLYDNLNGQPNNRLGQATGLITGTQGGGATGDNNTGSIAMSTPMPPGLYWAAVVSATTAPILTMTNGISGATTQSGIKEIIGIADVTSTNFNAVVVGWAQSNATLPTSAASLSTNTTKPFIFGVAAAL